MIIVIKQSIKGKIKETNNTDYPDNGFGGLPSFSITCITAFYHVEQHAQTNTLALTVTKHTQTIYWNVRKSHMQ